MTLLSNVVSNLFGTSSRSEPSLPELIAAADAKMTAGDAAGAKELCQRILTLSPGNAQANNLLMRIQFDEFVDIAKNRFPGPIYLDWLKWLHQTLAPTTYLEIGVQSGKSLQFAAPPTRAIGVDPAIQVVHPQEAWVKLFKMTSDDFFLSKDLRQIIQEDTVDFAFIDGLHTFDQALKDFVNVERYSSATTVVVLHDIFPIIPLTAERQMKSIFWVGDTWKIIPILRKNRPDLRIFTIPTYPSGLAVITGLDNHSHVLSDELESIVAPAMQWKLEEHQEELEQQLHLVRNDYSEVAIQLEHVIRPRTV